MTLLQKHESTINTWNPLLIHIDGEINKYSEQFIAINEKIDNFQSIPGPAGASGQKGDPGPPGNKFL